MTSVEEAAPTLPGRNAAWWLLAAIFLASICGLIFELVAGALASYLLGDSVTQFSIVIGLFLTSMGIGSFFSRFIKEHLIFRFILLEVAIGVVGGFAALVGFVAFAYTEQYQAVLILSVITVGALVGLEIPLVIRILKEVASLRVTVANVLGMDYLGAFAASLLFPFFLLPQFGIVRAGLIAGLLNLAVAAVLLRVLRPSLAGGTKVLTAVIAGSALLLIGATLTAGQLVSHLENRSYQDEIIFRKITPYQRIVVTRWRGDVRLYLNGHLQFSSVDEYRYHESLAHPAMAAAERPRKILILGGGDGLLAREVLKYKDVEAIKVVDLDPAVTDLFRENALMRDLNGDSLNDPRVAIVNDDALRFLQKTEEIFDVVLCDLPDPSETGLDKLYSRSFYGLIGRRLAPYGVFATQATSPFRSRKAFWCIANTISATQRPGPSGEKFHAAPYHTVVPTFGTWGFVLAASRPIPVDSLAPSVETRYLNRDVLKSLFTIPEDMGRVDTPVNQLNDPCLSRLYREGYHKYLR